MLRTLPLVVLIQGLLFYYYDLYSGLWRYVSFADMQNIVEASLISLILILNINLLFEAYLGAIPKSIYVLDFLLLAAFAGGSRLVVRSTRERIMWWRERSQHPRVVIVGPVKVAEPLVREMLNSSSGYLPVAIIDPDSQFQGSRIHNILICGGFERLVPLIQRYGVQEVLFAWPEAPEYRLNQIIEDCRPFGVRFKMVPSLQHIYRPGAHRRLPGQPGGPGHRCRGLHRLGNLPPGGRLSATAPGPPGAGRKFPL
jgi:FlaA1/EpsC-like NDP-sugar epimerase